MGRLVITGAAGYIGGRLLAALLADRRDVHAVVRRPIADPQLAHTVCDLSADDGVTRLTEACRGAETLIHLAGENEVLSARAPAAGLASTTVATERVSEACAAAGVRRVVYMSTVHVYGARMQPGTSLHENLRVEPRSAYSIARLASEHVAASLAEGHYELVTFRLTNSVGAPANPAVDRWSLVANDLCRQAARSGELRLRSDGLQWRDFVPLQDVCAALISASVPGGPVAPGLYNLGSGRSITVRALAEMVQQAFLELTGRRPELHAPPAGPVAPAAYQVDVGRAREHGLTLDSPLRDAVTETARFCLTHVEQLPA